MQGKKFVAMVACLALASGLTACLNQDGAQKLAFIEIEPGLSYVDSLVGEGASAGATDFVLVHYTGWLYSEGERGEEFDSSVKRGEPIGLPLGRGLVIPGWDKGLVGMKIGGKRTLLIEPNMGYGEQGRLPVIPPNSTLMFDIELVEMPRVDLEILSEGDGPMAELGDQVSVEYTGWLWENGAKGEEFDSSTRNGRPYLFALGRGRVIPGWDMAIKGMKTGTKAVVIIPPELAYGEQGRPPVIPPAATLCFEIELVGIEGK